LDAIKGKSWFPNDALPDIAKNPDKPMKTLRFNVGGQHFEASEQVLKRDPSSLLATLCSDKSPLQLNEDGVLYFDRDW
jgi:hypothetical protein